MRGRWPILALIVAAGGCDGQIAGRGGGSAGAGNIGGPGAGGAGGAGSSGGPGAAGAGASTSTPVTFACDANAAPPVATLRRLTMTQVRNTVSDLTA